MGMFKIKKGSRVIVTKDFMKKVNVVSKEDTYFGKEELVIDPHGINKYASIPQEHLHTVGGVYAKNGYYGFKRTGKQLFFITAASNVVYL